MMSSWIAALLATACVCLGAFHLARLATARRDGRGIATEAAHAATGFGMAAMFAPGADPLPTTVWVVIFAGTACWFGAVAVRAGARVDDAGHHVVCGVAMLLMLYLGVGEQHAHDGMGAMEGLGVTGGTGPAAWTTSVAALALAGYFGSHALLCMERYAGARPGCGHEGAPAAATTAGITTTITAPTTAPGLLRLVRASHVAAAAHLAAAVGMAVMLIGMI